MSSRTAFCLLYCVVAKIFSVLCPELSTHYRSIVLIPFFIGHLQVIDRHVFDHMHGWAQGKGFSLGLDDAETGMKFAFYFEVIVVDLIEFTFP